MKIIRSFGGPYIGLHRSDMHLWSGNDGKSFTGESSPSTSDYEAGGLLTEGRRYPPCNIAKIVGENAVGLLISLPFEIAVVQAKEDHVYLAQVHYGPEDWTLSSVNPSAFQANEDRFDEHIDFTSSGGEFVFFDSVGIGGEVKDSLHFNLKKGDHVFSSLDYNLGDEVLLTLFKIVYLGVDQSRKS